MQTLRLIDPNGYDVPGIRRQVPLDQAADAERELLAVEAPIHATGSAVGYNPRDYTVKKEPVATDGDNCRVCHTGKITARGATRCMVCLYS